MSRIVLILGPLNFIFILIFLRALFVLSSSQVHFFWSSGKWSIFQRIRNNKLCQSGIVDLTVAIANGERSSVSVFYVLWTTFLSIWCWMSPLSLTPALTSWPMQSKQGDKNEVQERERFSFCSLTMGIEQFEGTLDKKAKRLVLYACKKTHTYGLTCTPLRRNLSVNVCLRAREDA